MKYTVSNTYGIAGESSHRTAAAAINARDRREGVGWIVTDESGNEWTMNGPDAMISRRAGE